MVKKDQAIAQECYQSSLEVTREPLTLGSLFCPKMYDINTANWDPMFGVECEKLTPTEDLKETQIGPSHHQVTKFGT